MTTATDPTPAAPVTALAPVPVSDAALAVWDSMLDQVPETPDDDANERILAQLAQASAIAQLDDPWRSEGMKAYRDVPLRVTDITRRPSDFEGPIPFFLVVKAGRLDTGELVTFTTSALGAMAQLVKAYVSGWLPLDVIPRQAERPTRAGYWPMHLEVIRNGGK
jgi:hypothetical protein